jgi:hypothetical protein
LWRPGVSFSARCIGKGHIFEQLGRVSEGRAWNRRDVLITPRIREAIRSTIWGFEGFFDLMRIAVLETTVSMGFKPAAFIVSPDSRNGQ